MGILSTAARQVRKVKKLSKPPTDGQQKIVVKGGGNQGNTGRFCYYSYFCFINIRYEFYIP